MPPRSSASTERRQAAYVRTACASPVGRENDRNSKIDEILGVPIRIVKVQATMLDAPKEPIPIDAFFLWSGVVPNSEPNLCLLLLLSAAVSWRRVS